MYWEALSEGKEKIPYCSMLILGDEEVGKTSLYRQLVGKDFKEDLDRTSGIDNNTVDTVDRRKVDINEWKQRESLEEVGGFVKALSKEIVKNLPPPPPDDGGIKEEVSEKDLMERIMGTVERIRERRVSEQSDLQPQPSTHLPTSASETEVQKKKDESIEPRQKKKNPLLREPHTKPKTLPDATLQDITPPDTTPLDTTPSDANPSDATPPNVPPNPAEEEPVAMLNQKQSSILDSAVRKRVVDSKNPSLVLNTLDFAGQKLYRPMHHCFISRRALYIVVFKIPDMLEEASHKKSLEEVRYWIHSIHSHIYPPEKDMKGEDKKIKRVFLVGTHRGDHTDGDLKKIDKLINDKLIGDESCCNHMIYPVGPVGELSYPTNYFIPVENQIDRRKHGRDYLRDSGTGVVQNLVKTTSTRLPFLDEYYPIKWLKFEERLKKQMETLSTTPVMTVKGVKTLAIRSNITSEDQQDLALKFFHDTGKIICISELI